MPLMFINHARSIGVGMEVPRSSDLNGIFITLYFTDFPTQLPLFHLMKGFEVCGILKDVEFIPFANLRFHDIVLHSYHNLFDVL
ncbi:hypothetical protein MtrunA17_Chr6g0463631 [Medicago truncatula]|uniref:Uncharacterized protein n=1 Tax=Medicago truncatula TaxID=3880 RepID=A0A396HCE8_MEDTR|nr:hypothetical protein MtrunA17_Chr6g0463631 [Medicago truncatula]